MNKAHAGSLPMMAQHIMQLLQAQLTWLKDQIFGLPLPEQTLLLTIVLLVALASVILLAL